VRRHSFEKRGGVWTGSNPSSSERQGSYTRESRPSPYGGNGGADKSVGGGDQGRKFVQWVTDAGRGGCKWGGGEGSHV